MQENRRVVARQPTHSLGSTPDDDDNGHHVNRRGLARQPTYRLGSVSDDDVHYDDLTFTRPITVHEDAYAVPNPRGAQNDTAHTSNYYLHNGEDQSTEQQTVMILSSDA